MYINIIFKFTSLRRENQEEKEEIYLERKDDADYIIDFIQNDKNKIFLH